MAPPESGPCTHAKVLGQGPAWSSVGSGLTGGWTRTAGGRPGLDHASVSLAKETLPYGSGQPEEDFVLLTTSDLQRRA